MEDKDLTSWRKSSYSLNGGECVEAADNAGVILVRDTANRNAGVLAFGTAAWERFTATLR